MEVILNKDFTKFKAEKWKGTSRKEILSGVLLLITVGGGIFLFYFVCNVPLLISSIMILPVAMMIVLFGFYHPDGMSFLTYLKKSRGGRELTYKSIREEMDITEENIL